MKNKGNMLIVALVAVAILMIVGLFLFYSVSKKRDSQQQEISTQTDQQVEALNSQSISDELPVIENDLDNTNLDNLDQGVDQASNEAAGL